ncbi:short-chain dehydrogenase/reductase SDR [Thiorhodococcus drewsii AZ1]|uniref:Short-chain dehydrogenase/reductase SDR n=1 Tax=Thiorhodococcus drewsii AZ1 TaxID=765913 RepID=G2DYA8_9GAMM|nr:SDR family oxidoreductase [Thiorhodococcus drewsii]EGV32900.1 short-chain dehydrogenase/reductase SDR [Thiorhodococcus drewsii AZ1]
MGAVTHGERIVCITGGTSGIGAGLVAAFLEAGDCVYSCGRNPVKVERLLAAWPEAVAEGRLHLVRGDLTDEAFRVRWVASIAERSRRLDVLINNAGVILDSGTLEESLDHWRATLEVNLIAPFAMTQACAPLLESSSAPVVVNLSSACAQHPFASCTSTSYSVSKAGLDMLTRRLAMALGPRGIRVNGVAPGVVDSEMWEAVPDLMRETAERRHLLGRQAVMPRDVADAVLFLASPQARLVTGATLSVDAGYALG